jgi:hypothetical protein
LHRHQTFLLEKGTDNLPAILWLEFSIIAFHLFIHVVALGHVAIIHVGHDAGSGGAVAARRPFEGRATARGLKIGLYLEAQFSGVE